MAKKITTEQWIEAVNIVHNYKYNYSNAIYTGAINKIKIICPIHGEFEQLAQNHKGGSGCPRCGQSSSIDKHLKTLDQFLQEAKEIHGNKYNYDKVVYTNGLTKICITCPIHGDFWQQPACHKKGQGCRKCGIDSRLKDWGLSQEQVIHDFVQIHGTFYDYSKVKYVKSTEKVIIICPIHGEFLQAPHSHKKGEGCFKCGQDKTHKSNLKSQDQVLEEFKLIHKDKYDYSKFVYTTSHTKIIIICSIHGEFLKTPTNHLMGSGCPICNYSKGEKLIQDWLLENEIPFRTQLEVDMHEIARNTTKVRIDFFVKYKEKQYFIEYDGRQHFEYVPHFHKGGIMDLQKQQNRDRVLEEFCELHKDKVTLIRFNYSHTFIEINNILTTYFIM